MSDQEFQDIRITGLDIAATEQSSTAPGLRYMHLTLSTRAPAVWCEIFENERKFPRHSHWRHAWALDKNIIVDCVPEEMEEHLRDLKVDVANTNSKYRDHLNREKAKLIVEKKAAQDERDRLEGIKDRLSFD